MMETDRLQTLLDTVSEETMQDRTNSDAATSESDVLTAVEVVDQEPVKPKKRKQSQGERVFSCTFENCNKTFTQLAHLRIHQRKHTGERPYVCSWPGCAKSFTQLGNLKTHERKHTGERPFKCSFEGCGKAFSQMGNMKTHEQLHLGIRPYKCTVEGCEKSFTQLGNLKSHTLKVHTKQEPEPIPNHKLPIRKRKPAEARQPSMEEILLTQIKAVVNKKSSVA
ncbi:hypothetical protein EDD86DRAFT_213350 [Gorgonomyces haynaldii]|nr:hypothetical protein EDD86DRAFT_213350 [Gorgonomyces haynaldii]